MLVKVDTVYTDAETELRMNDSTKVPGHHVLTREQYEKILGALKKAQRQEHLLSMVNDKILNGSISHFEIITTIKVALGVGTEHDRLLVEDLENE